LNTSDAQFSLIHRNSSREELLLSPGESNSLLE
jgi:hypothetical protein